jgi:hypothetical protein
MGKYRSFTEQNWAGLCTGLTHWTGLYRADQEQDLNGYTELDRIGQD